MTGIRLLNKQIQVATKEEGKNIASDTDNDRSIHLHNKQGQKKSNSNRVTQQRKHSKQQTRTKPAGTTAEATSSPTKSKNDRIKEVVGDSIIKNLQGKGSWAKRWSTLRIPVTPKLFYPN